MNCDRSYIQGKLITLLSLAILCGIASCDASLIVESPNANDLTSTAIPDTLSSGIVDSDDSAPAIPPGESSVVDEPVTPEPSNDASPQFEEEVLVLVNKQRSSGADCGNAGSFDPTHPLTMNVKLQSAARNHSLDMASREYFDHVNPDGENPGQRIATTGYSATTWGENIAWGQTTPEQVVASWMSSSGHCANIMGSSFTEIGIGYDPANFWTQVFATPSTR